MDYLLPIVQTLIIAAYWLRLRISGITPSPLRDLFVAICMDMRFKLDRWQNTIIIPVVVIVAVYLGWYLFNAAGMGAIPLFVPSEPLPVYILTSGILAPIAEQILQGALLSVAFVLAVHTIKDKRVVIGACAVVLVATACMFASSHNNPSMLNYALRSCQFAIYGSLYYLSGRNLLPAIFAHSAWNMILLTPALL